MKKSSLNHIFIISNTLLNVISLITTIVPWSLVLIFAISTASIRLRLAEFMHEAAFNLSGRPVPVDDLRVTFPIILCGVVLLVLAVNFVIQFGRVVFVMRYLEIMHKRSIWLMIHWLPSLICGILILIIARIDAYTANSYVQQSSYLFPHQKPFFQLLQDEFVCFARCDDKTVRPNPQWTCLTCEDVIENAFFGIGLSLVCGIALILQVAIEMGRHYYDAKTCTAQLDLYKHEKPIYDYRLKRHVRIAPGDAINGSLRASHRKDLGQTIKSIEWSKRLCKCDIFLIPCHINVMPLKCFFRDDQHRLFTTYEYVDDTLETLIYKRHFGQAETDEYFEQIASALSYLHSRRMYHLNLKPSNILCRRNGLLAIADYPLVPNKSDTYETREPKFGRSSIFKAPELMFCEKDATFCTKIDKADVYSYGVLIYEILFQVQALDEQCKEIERKLSNGEKMQEERKLLRNRNADILNAFDADEDQEIGQLVMACLQDAEKRPTFAEIYEKLITHRYARSYPQPEWDHLKRRLKRGSRRMHPVSIAEPVDTCDTEYHDELKRLLPSSSGS